MYVFMCQNMRGRAILAIFFIPKIVNDICPRYGKPFTDLSARSLTENTKLSFPKPQTMYIFPEEHRFNPFHAQ